MNLSELLQNQKELESIHNKNLLWNRVYTEVKKDTELQSLIKESGVNEKLALKTLAVLAVYKRLEVATLVAMLFKPEGELTLDQVCTEVENLYKSGFMHYNPDDNRFVVKYCLDEPVQRELDAYQYPLPLIVKPKLLKHNFSSGYYMKGKESVLLNNKSTHKDVDLEHLNLMNQVEFSLNKEVLKKAKNIWNINSSKDNIRTQKQFDRFNKYCKVAQNIMLETGNKFYFSHRYDYRGRTYCEGYYLNYQGNDYCKAVLEFSNKEIIE